MEQFGVFIGIGLLLVVGAAAWLLGRKAHSGVKEFRMEHHERFTGRKKP